MRPPRFPQTTALRETCILETPSDLINRAWLYAKDNIARCMRYYSLGWGMSNSPHRYTIVVGRDTGWMCLGTDYVAPWFAPAALAVFRDRQKPNGQIVEYVDLETGRQDDYGLNISDNTPLYLWAVCHQWEQFADPGFGARFAGSVLQAADHLLAEVGPRGLLVGIPAGKDRWGICSWRNIIPDAVIAGEVTEINALSAMALRMAGRMLNEDRYLRAADRLADAVEERLWSGECYCLNCDGRINPQVTGDAIFPVLADVAEGSRAKAVLDRLSQKDFWSPAGMRTVPNSDGLYHPSDSFGLMGGSWPNLTLWYAAAMARHDPDRALAAIEAVARPAVEAMPPEANIRPGEFPEWFDGEQMLNRGMHLSPWVAPTFLWAVMEGLLGCTWRNGSPQFRPHWPTGWDRVSIRRLPCAAGAKDYEIATATD